MTRNPIKSPLPFTLAATALALSLAGPARAESKPAPNADAQAARAEIQKMLGFVPSVLKAVPDNALPGAWGEIKALQVADTTALPCKVKEIIGVAVAAQLPSPALVYGHTQLAKLGGATQAELADGVAIAALTRHWSTFFNGVQLDEAKFRGEIARLVDGIKKAMASGAAPPSPLALTDAKSVMADLKLSYGFVPEFITKFPADSVAPAWREERDVEMAPSALSDKYKSLVGLAVAAQIPCKYCLIADTEFAKLSGATDKEIGEAVAMSGFVRHWATMQTGFGVDDATYKKDVDRMIHALQKGQAASAAGAKRAATAMTNTKR
jgi:AhpD family alkylhydroperoxidase